MIRIIEPPSHAFYQPKIDAVLDLFKVYMNISLPLEEQAKTTFMIAENEKCGVYGGILLCKKKGDVFDHKITKVISVLHSTKRKFWTATLCVGLAEDETLSAFDKLELCEEIYQSLFKKLMAFGKKEDANFLVLSSRSEDAFKTKTYGHWPYLIEVQTKDSRNDLFHGILDLKSMKPSTYKDYRKILERLRPIKRATT
jgi:hypothetical protein